MSHLSNIERIESKIFGFFEAHDLNEHVPRWEASFADRVVQVANAVIRIRSRQLGGFLNVEIFNALCCTEVELAVSRFAFAVLKLESVTSIAVHESESIGDSAITEQEHHLVRGFWPQGNEIPICVWIFQVRRWVPLLRVNETGEQDRISNEKYRRVIADKIPNAIIRVEFHCESSWIANRVGTSAFSGNS